MCVCACVWLVEGVPLCVPCGGQRLSAQTAAGESEWWSPSMACVDVSVVLRWAAYVYLCRARAVGVFRRPGRSRCAPDARTRTRVRRNARLGCAQRLSRLPSRRSGARGLWILIRNVRIQSVSQFRRRDLNVTRRDLATPRSRGPAARGARSPTFLKTPARRVASHHRTHSKLSGDSDFLTWLLSAAEDSLKNTGDVRVNKRHTSLHSSHRSSKS